MLHNQAEVPSDEENFGLDFMEVPRSRAEQLAEQYLFSRPAWERDPYSERSEREYSEGEDSEDFDWESYTEEGRWLDSSPDPQLLDKIEESDKRLAYLRQKGDHLGPEKARDKAKQLLQSIPIQEGKRGKVCLPNELVERMTGNHYDNSVDDGRFVYYSRQQAENQKLKAQTYSDGWGWGSEK